MVLAGKTGMEYVSDDPTIDKGSEVNSNSKKLPSDISATDEEKCPAHLADVALECLQSWMPCRTIDHEQWYTCNGWSSTDVSLAGCGKLGLELGGYDLTKGFVVGYTKAHGGVMMRIQELDKWRVKRLLELCGVYLIEMAPRKAKTIKPEPVGIEGEPVRVEETRVVVERGEPLGTNNKLDIILTQLAGVNQTIAHMDNRLNTLEQRKNPPRSHTSSYYRRDEPIGAVSEAFLGDARRASLGGLGVEPPRAHIHDPRHDPIRPQNNRHITHPQLTNETNGEPIHEELLLRFGDTTYVNHEIELRNLKQTSTVQDYQAKFERLSSMVKNRPVESKIAHFIGGLNEDIQIEMLRDPPTELRRCFALAKVIEEQFRRRDAQKKVHKPGFVSKPQANIVRTAPPKKALQFDSLAAKTYLGLPWAAHVEMGLGCGTWFGLV
ncbi:hypothetical protein EJ110_NYTH13049 [Nymphaea thermarum]|nr:hypothetical protein EJ110_NYTH13049 [Nymphaea thermarum]